MIQVALFALFQLVEYYDERSGGDLLIGAFLALLVVGIGLFIGAAKVKFPSIIFIVQGLVITVAFRCCCKVGRRAETTQFLIS